MSAVEDVRDRMAQAMCAVETRSKAATLEEVQAGIQRWTRHRYEAERLIAELADYGLMVALSSPPADDVREALDDVIRRHWVATPGEFRKALLSDPRLEVRLRGTVTETTDAEFWRTRTRAALTAAAVVHPRGTVTEPCEWCPEQHTGFAEWQGDGLALPSCGREGHGMNYEPTRFTEPTDAEKNTAWEVFWRNPEMEEDDLRAAFDAGYDAAWEARS
ncbi:hypothetical protein CSIV_05155 [Microbacterium sp. CSI-V]|uniref:hypothetical protein n=1 Tax=Microbacterium sp. CSI-V TaxID=1933777 RepID=UPI00097BFD5E|nr:hypothetical protein [Microbacterium sp. CSI-V]ONI65668.1 hypothetical protein CSIV_05155 [Microbacterium sp. CSI-V]